MKCGLFYHLLLKLVGVVVEDHETFSLVPSHPSSIAYIDSSKQTFLTYSNESFIEFSLLQHDYEDQ